MKKIYFITLAIVALLTSCSQSVDDTKVLVPTPGKDVNFSLNISNNATRTLYGDETVNENGEKAWVVTWADFDFVSIYGKDCSASRNQAVYYVTPHVEDEQHLNYADSLVITGEYGVQWGESATSDFYSVYPAKDNAFSIVNGKVTAQATVRTEQTNAFKSTNVNGVKIWKGQPYVIDKDNKVATMPDALMYAYTPNATNESIVNLRYVPISTVLNFTLKGWDSTLDLADPTVFVSEITLTAPNGTKIAGDCTLTFDDSGKPTVAAAANATNTITIKPTAGDNEFLPLDRGDWAEFNVFIIPSEVDANQHDLAKGDWTITLKTASGHGTHTYTLKPNGGNAVLKSGQIHKLSVPTVNVISTFSYDPAKWIESIPRNVYLSELSMPGAWYATDSGYQGEIGIGTNNADGIDTGLVTLYNAGVRAFNIDCRLTGKPGVAIKDYGYNHHTALVVWKYYTANDNMDYINGDDPTLILACAGTEISPSVESTVTPSNAAIQSIGLTVKDALISLGKLAEKHPNEFIEVILTVSQKPKSEGRSYDAQNRYGTVAPKLMLHAISNTLNDATVKQYLYQEEITGNTTVGDVLGKVVVKLNMNTTDAKFSTYGAVKAPMLISEASMASGGEGYTYSEDIVDADGQFSSMQQRAIYWADNSYTVGENTLKYYYHQAQATSGTPSMEQRKAAIKSIVQATHNNNADHNIFYQIGIGGTDQTKVANTLGEYVYAALQAKLNSGTWEGLKLEPSPLGAVLMNYVTTNQYSKDLTKGIIDMNGKFELLKDEDKPKWPGAEGEGDETEGM